MFGLLKNSHKCNSESKDFRLNYCGTCKTIGKVYGHKERLLLNFDVVFLSELLTSIYGQDKVNDVVPYSCMSLPKDEDEIAIHLKYCASINVLLSSYKILDNDIDSKYKWNLWKALSKLTNKNFKKSQDVLSGYGLSVGTINKLIEEQFDRENRREFYDDVNQHLEYYYSTTAEITGLVFKHGLVEHTDVITDEQMYDLGKNFGKIVYLIDAIEDYEQDVKKGQFNPLIISYKSDLKNQLQETKNEILGSLENINTIINSLNIDENTKAQFISRLSLSIHQKLNADKKVENKLINRPKLSVKERVEIAQKRARFVTKPHSSTFRKKIAYAYLAPLLIIFCVLFPSLAHAANDLIQTNGENCNNCNGNSGAQLTICGDCCSMCCENTRSSCCGDRGPGWGRRGYCQHIGDDFYYSCWPQCWIVPGLCCACSCCAGGEASGPTVIIKIIEVPAKAGSACLRC